MEQETYDGYCERIDPSFWAEPLNAVTNTSFLVAALIMAYRLRGQVIWPAWVLVAFLVAIGVGSFLFHTFATGWAAASDVIPIILFSLFYIFIATREYIGLHWVWGVFAVVAFFPYAAATAWFMGAIGLDGTTASYTPIAFLIAAYGIYLLRDLPDVGRGLIIGASLLGLSLTFRALDIPLCDQWPIGTHFVWHLLNGVMLGWMIEVYRRHRLSIAAEQS